MTSSDGQIAVTLCPECGTPTSERGVPPAAGWTSWRRMAPLVSVFVACIVLVVTLWNGRASSGMAPGMPQLLPVEFVRPFFTVADLRKIAAGEVNSEGALGGALIDRGVRWLVRPPGEEYLRVQFRPNDGTKRVTRNHGWPAVVVSVVESHEYVDVIAERPIPVDIQNRAAEVTGGAMSASTDMFWQGGQIVMTKPSAPGAYTRDTLFVDVVAAAGLLALPVAAWYAAVCVTALCSRRRDPARRRRAARIAGSIAIVVVTIALGAAALWFPTTREVLAPGSYSLWIGQSGGSTQLASYDERTTDITHRQLETLAEQPGGDQEIASRLLGMAGGSSSDWHLCAAFTVDSARGGQMLTFDAPWRVGRVDTVQRWYTGRPVDSGAQLGRQTPFGFQPPATVAFKPSDRVTWPAAPAAARHDAGVIQLTLPRSQPTQNLHSVTIEIGGVLLVLLFLWTIWISTRWVCFRRAALTTRRRIAARQCVTCGYSLAEESPLLT